MLLHEQRARTRWVHCDAMDAVADLCIRIRNVLRVQAAVDWSPRFASVISAERARGRDGDVHSLGIARIEKNRVQTHPHPRPAATLVPCRVCAAPITHATTCRRQLCGTTRRLPLRRKRYPGQ